MTPMEKRYRLTMSWNYEKEERWLNDLSAQGLHLRQPGLVRSWFVQDKTVRYTYGLDYQPELQNNDKKQEYIDLYRDAGWEYVTSYGGMNGGIWHYFRREWEPGDRPRLYSDWESLAAHYKKIQRMMTVAIFTTLVIFLVSMTNLLANFGDRLWGILIPVMAIYLLLFILLGYGYMKLGRKIKKLAE